MVQASYFIMGQVIELLMVYLVPFGLLLLCQRGLGQQEHTFLSKYRRSIQDYIMTGHENGWQHCDILSANASPHEGIPHITRSLENVKSLDTESSFRSSHCLLVIYDVNSNQNLSTLLEFGWKAIRRVRLALVLKMGPGISLDMASNSSTFKMPFLVAAELKDGKEQFLCPVVGESEPKLEEQMCSSSYVSHKGKTLRMGIMGIPPYYLLGPDGNIMGTNIMITHHFAQRLGFKPQLFPVNSYNAAENLVCHLKIILDNMSLLLITVISVKQKNCRLLCVSFLLPPEHLSQEWLHWTCWDLWLPFFICCS